MKLYQSIMAALATTAAVWLAGLLAVPIAKPLAWALIIGIATMPHYRRLKAFLPQHPSLSAGLMVLILTLFMVLPSTLLIIVIAQDSSEWYQEIDRLTLSLSSAEQHPLHHLPALNKLLVYLERIGIDLTGYAAKVASNASRHLVDAAANVAVIVANSLLNLVVTLFILFFVYRDGDEIVTAGIHLFVGHELETRHYLSEIRSTTTAVMVGTLFTCMVQGVLAGLAYYAAGTRLPVLWAVLTAVAGLVPVVGTAVVWGPLAALLAFKGNFLAALLLSLWCFIVVVAVTDNVIRPLAVGARSDIPALAVILGAVGGVMAMGLLGLFLGPIIFAIVVTVWRDLTEPSSAAP